MTDSRLHNAVDLDELQSRYHEKTLAIETAIAVQKSHTEINQLYQELKNIQQEINLAVLKEELLASQNKELKEDPKT
jgi:hypothetical protein